MKRICLIFITLSLIFIFQSCEKELPYPIDEVKRGVVLDVSRVAGTDGTIFRNELTGTFKVKVTIPPNQGDYSMMEYAQLVAVFQNVDGTYKSKVLVDNITTFPSEHTIDLPKVYSDFGLSLPQIKETLYITANVVMKDGSVIKGWSKEFGFNNVAFGGWIFDGRAYSSNVRYPVVCPLRLDDFVGTFDVTTDTWWEEEYEVTISKLSDTELSISGLYEGEADNPLKVKIDLTSYTLSFAKQMIVINSSAWWGPTAPITYNNFSVAGDGTINACDYELTLTYTASVDAGTFAGKNVLVMKRK